MQNLYETTNKTSGRHEVRRINLGSYVWIRFRYEEKKQCGLDGLGCGDAKPMRRLLVEVGGRHITRNLGVMKKKLFGSVSGYH